MSKTGRDGPTDLDRRTFLKGTVASTLVGTGVPTGTAGPATASTIVAADPPANVTYTLSISIPSRGGTATVAFRAAYPARSDSEAARAEEGTLTPDWFDGERRVRAVFEQVADEDDELTSGATSSWHAEKDWDATPREPEHGWVTVEYTVGWRGFFGPDDDRAVVGPSFASDLRPGDRLVVTAPSRWQPESVRGDPRRRSSGEAETEYVWTIREGARSPGIAFDRNALTAAGSTRTDGQSVSPVGGIVVATVAVLVIAAIGWIRNER